MLRTLPRLDVDVEHWDPFVTLIINSKLDDETRSDWKQQIGRREVTTARMIDFLELRAIELQPTQGDKLSVMLRGDNRRPPRNIFQVSEQQKPEKENKKLECLICKGPHRLWNCKKLLAECAKTRTEIIKSLRVCFKCLLKHQMGLCENEECNYCGGPHHVLLCYKKENSMKQNKGNQNFRHGLNQKKQNWQEPQKPKQELPKPKEDDDWN